MRHALLVLYYILAVGTVDPGPMLLMSSSQRLAPLRLSVLHQQSTQCWSFDELDQLDPCGCCLCAAYTKMPQVSF